MKEPPPIAILSARLARAFPSLSTYSAAFLAAELEAVERAQRRHAERACNGDYASPNYFRERNKPASQAWVAPDAEERAGKRIENKVRRWRSRLDGLVTGREAPGMVLANVVEGIAIELQGDPRGPVLLLKLPGEAEAVAV